MPINAESIAPIVPDFAPHKPARGTLPTFWPGYMIGASMALAAVLMIAIRIMG